MNIFGSGNVPMKQEKNGTKGLGRGQAIFPAAEMKDESQSTPPPHPTPTPAPASRRPQENVHSRLDSSLLLAGDIHKPPRKTLGPSTPVMADSLVSLKLRNTETTFLTVGIKQPVTYQLTSLPPREKCQLPTTH